MGYAEETLDRLLRALRAGRVVLLDVEGHHSASTEELASELAEKRTRHVLGGERVAFTYADMNAADRNDWTHADTVSNDQVPKLIAEGARWIDPDFYAPV